MIQMTEHLPGNYKALSLVPTTAKQMNKQTWFLLEIRAHPTLV
jgi:hypothetical protein